jgi:hypothetical protein
MSVESHAAVPAYDTVALFDSTAGRVFQVTVGADHDAPTGFSVTVAGVVPIPATAYPFHVADVIASPVSPDNDGYAKKDCIVPKAVVLPLGSTYPISPPFWQLPSHGEVGLADRTYASDVTVCGSVVVGSIVTGNTRAGSDNHLLSTETITLAELGSAPATSPTDTGVLAGAVPLARSPDASNAVPAGIANMTLPDAALTNWIVPSSAV